MKAQGDIGEIQFMLKAAQKGLIISIPFGDNQKYDLLVDSNNTIYRVQVKSCSKKDNQESFKVTTSYGSKVKRPYTINDIDFLAIYIIPKNLWYIFPAGMIDTKMTIRLRANQTCKFSQNIEAWNLLL